MKNTNWSTELISEMQQAKIVNDMATTSFVDAYKNGDSVEAWQAMEEKSCRSEVFDPNGYVLLIFADGSCYADWKEGLDRFYPTIGDLIGEDSSVAERLV